MLGKAGKILPILKPTSCPQELPRNNSRVKVQRLCKHCAAPFPRFPLLCHWSAASCIPKTRA